VTYFHQFASKVSQEGISQCNSRCAKTGSYTVQRDPADRKPQSLTNTNLSHAKSSQPFHL